MDEVKIWYALGCRSPRQEIKIRDEARKVGLEAFVPLSYEVKTVRGRKERKLIPALTGLLFAKGTLDDLKAYCRASAYPVFIKRSTFSNREDYLTIPTRAMEDFIAVTQHREEHVSYFKPGEIHLQEGDRIRIKGGLYDGREGIVMRIKGKRNRHLVVQIPGFLVAAIELAPELVEIKESVDLRERKSKDVPADTKRLYELAHRLLFEIPDKYKHEEEYYLLLSELRRTRERLKGIKGFTPATEANLALPLYLSALLLNDSVDESKFRLATSIAKLKDASALKAKCLELLQKLK